MWRTTDRLQALVRSCLPLLLLLTGFASLAQEAEVVSVASYVDKTDRLTVAEISSASVRFETAPNKVPSLDLQDHTVWFRVEVKNTFNDSLLFINVDVPYLDEIILYGGPKGTDSLGYSGEKLAYSKRQIKHQNALFPVKQTPGSVQTYYLKVRSTAPIYLTVKVQPPLVLQNELSRLDHLHGIYFGVMLIMILYNLFLGFSIREKDRTYIRYSLYLIIVTLTQGSLLGYTQRAIFREDFYLADTSIFFFSSIVPIFAMRFTQKFLHTETNYRLGHRLLYIFMFLYLICAGLSLTPMKNLCFTLLQPLSLSSIITLIIAIRIARKGFRYARWFAFAWAAFLLGVLLYGIKGHFGVPYNFFTINGMEIGSAFEAALLSIALADRINVLQADKERVTAENNRILREQNTILDEKVRLRTAELVEKNQEIEKAMRELQETQTQLVNAEKMASLGQLTAGIAHEINNPINFITGNIKPLKRDVEDVLSVVHLYEKSILGSNATVPDISAVKKLKEDIDFDYTVQEINSLLKGIEEGANRTSEIVKGLRIFSRVDEADQKKVDIHEGLDSTLILLQSQLRNHIAIRRNYGELPPVECYPGKLNQLFMNILNNSIYAIQQRPSGHEGIISITTGVEGHWVNITLADNGVGMDKSTLDRVFEPFFTTKPVGIGTGLGMAIVHSIIELHKGKISVQSSPETGTSITISIPADF